MTHFDGHEFVPDETTDHGWPSYTCATCGKPKWEHSDGTARADGGPDGA